MTPLTTIDANGRSVPGHAADAFRHPAAMELAVRVAAAMDEASRAEGLVTSLEAVADMFPWVRLADVRVALLAAVAELESVRRDVSAGLPHAVCGGCGGRGCGRCKGCGYWPRGGEPGVPGQTVSDARRQGHRPGLGVRPQEGGVLAYSGRGEVSGEGSPFDHL